MKSVMTSPCVHVVLAVQETEEATRQQLEAGFGNVSFTPKEESADYIKEWDENKDVAELVLRL